jgi:hypothetical protein
MLGDSLILLRTWISPWYKGATPNSYSKTTWEKKVNIERWYGMQSLHKIYVWIIFLNIVIYFYIYSRLIESKHANYEFYNLFLHQSKWWSQNHINQMMTLSKLPIKGHNSSLILKMSFKGIYIYTYPTLPLHVNSKFQQGKTSQHWLLCWQVLFFITKVARPLWIFIYFWSLSQGINKNILKFCQSPYFISICLLKQYLITNFPSYFFKYIIPACYA